MDYVFYIFQLSAVPRNACHIVGIPKKNVWQEVFASMYHHEEIAIPCIAVSTDIKPVSTDITLLAPSEFKHLEMSRYRVLKSSIQMVY